jgi:outer membrane lipoprotein-sorting protein
MHRLPASGHPRTGRGLRLLGPIAVVLGVLGHIGAARAEPDPGEIVQRADAIRFPQAGFQADVRITTTAPDREPDVREYRILSKGNENTLIMTTAPAAERGNILLMRGRDLWGFVPRVSQPVRLPLAQRLTGQVANGDLARANFAGDYTPQLLRTEEVEGRPHYVLELRASGRGVTYPRVLYWVERETFRPRRAEFYTLSNRLFKTCEYEAYRPVAGETRPTRLVMTDRLRSEERSVLDYEGIQPRDLPDVVFTKDYLKKLQ